MKNRYRQFLSIFLAMLMSLGLTTLASAQDSKNSKDSKDSKNAKDDVEQIGDRDVGKGMNFYSLEEEIALGKSMAQQVEQQSRLIQDPVVSEYINRIGQNLVRNSDAQVPFTIKVIDDESWNAFALPGGFFYVNTGLILAADSEAEIAGAMAHEIAHVAARHGTRNASKAELANWLSLPLIFLGGPVGFGARSAAGLLIPMKFLQFSRGAEREADFLGLQYLYKTGYDPDAFVGFFEKMQAREKNRPGSLAKAFATHPLTPDRIDAAQDEIRNVLPSRDEYIVTTGEFERVHERLRMLDNRGRVEDAQQDNDRPTLRRRTTASPSATDSSDPAAPDSSVDDSGATDDANPSDEDARPTLKRR
ncbi:MAG: M48 family metalloprotease [Acidobacteria bacterium]|nr:M48 family metalloprotease [Acidobacteriota bacterium]